MVKILFLLNMAYGGDEINKILKGKNYGYPEASYGDSMNLKIIMRRI